jgi:hypothetical protein
MQVFNPHIRRSLIYQGALESQKMSGATGRGSTETKKVDKDIELTKI